MTAEFDPYYRWLAIPPEDQPPDHYRLLGLKPLESDPEIIETSADRQMAHVRTYQSGAHAGASQKLLNALSAAKVCLLDPKKKQAYDQGLKQKLAARNNASRVAALPVATSFEEKLPSPDAHAPRIDVARTGPRSGPNRSKAIFAFAGVAIGGVLLGAASFVAFWLTRQNDSPPAAVAAADERADDSDRPGEQPIGDRREDRPAGDPQPTAQRRPTSAASGPRTDADVGDGRVPAVPVGSPTVTIGGAEFGPGGAGAAGDSKPAQGERPNAHAGRGDAASPAAGQSAPSAAAASAGSAKKVQVPPEATRQGKRAEIVSLFSIDELPSDEEKGRLASQLFESAGEMRDEPAAHYAMLDLAREMALATGDFELALQAVGEINKTFEVDQLALAADVCREALELSLTTSRREELMRRSLAVVDQAADADRFEIAGPLAQALTVQAVRASDIALRKQVRDTARQVKVRQDEWTAVRPALERLKLHPEDPVANLQVGTYLCLHRGKWAEGLSHLVKSEDGPLKQAAAADLALPKSAEEQVKLADAWYALSQSGTEDAAWNASAGYWYRRALPELSAIDRLRVQQRLTEIGTPDVPRTDGEPATAAAPQLAGEAAPAAESVSKPLVELKNLQQRLRSIGNLDPDQRKQLLDESVACLKTSDLGASEFSFAINTCRSLERVDQEMAATAYDEFAEIFTASKDEKISRYIEKMKGAARRNRLPGNSIELFGTTVEGENFQWKNYQGKVVLIDFWATWCGPCVAELPNVKRNYELYHKKGFDVVGVSLDQDRSRLETFIRDKEVPWTCLFQDGAGWDHPMATHYGVMAIPNVILVDQSGKVVSLQARGAELGRQLERLLGAEKAKGSSARSSHDIVEKPASSSGKGDKNEPLAGEIPTPALAFKDKKGGQGLTRYRFTVTNGRAFPDELFEASPVGSNKRASRAVVTLYSSSGRRLSGFVAFKNGESLMNGIWFAVRDGEAPPEGVYVEILDRKLQKKYKSNVVKLMPKAN